jgi:hypothetical protein
MKTKYRLNALFVVTITSAISTMAVKAGPILGNGPVGGEAFSIAYEAGNTWGAAISFTTPQNVDLFSVTLWLTGYTGQNGQSICASIWNDANQLESFFPTQPGVKIADLITPSSNDGSLAAFTFYDALQTPILSGDTKYWLLVYGTGSLSGSSMKWVDGSSPTGGATFDGSEALAAGSFSSPGFTTPAFTINSTSEIINSVPEPSTLALALLGCGFVYHFRKKG